MKNPGGNLAEVRHLWKDKCCICLCSRRWMLKELMYGASVGGTNPAVCFAAAAGGGAVL